MSHIAKIDIEIRDLDALKAACVRAGCEFVEGQATYKWWGRWMRDSALPDGFTEDDLGKCTHAIRVQGADYEIGVVPRRDGRPGYQLLWDYWPSGGLEAKLGKGCGKLVQMYGVEAAKRAARRNGMSVTEQQQADGSVVLRVRA